MKYYNLIIGSTATAVLLTRLAMDNNHKVFCSSWHRLFLTRRLITVFSYVHACFHVLDADDSLHVSVYLKQYHSSLPLPLSHSLASFYYQDSHLEIAYY